jgi:hypothetical protein
MAAYQVTSIAVLLYLLMVQLRETMKMVMLFGVEGNGCLEIICQCHPWQVTEINVNIWHGKMSPYPKKWSSSNSNHYGG